MLREKFKALNTYVVKGASSIFSNQWLQLLLSKSRKIRTNETQSKPKKRSNKDRSKNKNLKYKDNRKKIYEISSSFWED